MNDDIRRLLTVAAVGAPEPPPMAREFRSALRRRRTRLGSIATLVVITIAVGSFAAVDRLSRAVDVAARDCAGSWRALDTQGLPDSVILYSATVAGESDIWFAGQESGTPKGRSVIMHWGGQAWIRRDLPRDPSTDSESVAIAAEGDNVWAGGFRSIYDPTSDKMKLSPLVFRWNGDRWLDVAPPPTPPDSGIWAISVKGDRVVVAGTSQTTVQVGSLGLQTSVTPFLADSAAGGPWRTVSLPDLNGEYSISKIVIERNGDLTLQTRGRGGTGFVTQSGRGWRILTPPGKPVVHGDVRGADDIWAVRPFVVASGRIEVLRFDGREWHTRFVPVPEAEFADGIIGAPRGRAWLVMSRRSESPPPSRPPGAYGPGPRGPEEFLLFDYDGRVARAEPVEIRGPRSRINSLVADAAGRSLLLANGGSFGRTIVLTNC